MPRQAPLGHDGPTTRNDSGDAACGWSSCNPPAEICGDGIDNDCDGFADEGCS
jgi:hypothetical protein